MKINILGSEWTITERSEAEDPRLENCDGYCDWTTREIVVEREITGTLGDMDAYVRKVKRHEIVHAYQTNIMAAVEAGIFTATTQARLLELEARKKDLSCLICSAKESVDNLLTREEIIATLELFQDGDVNDNDYQEALFDTFLIAAYLYDSKIRFVFNLSGKKRVQDVPFDIDSIELDGVRITENGGAEGNRTPVRKQLGKNFSGRSLLFTFPHHGGNKHSP